MRFPRSSGIVLHPTSLPGPFGIGDLGPASFEFADFLQESGQRLWQMLPLGPTGYGDSPYQCFSTHAGNPLLISPSDLVHRGWLAKSDVADLPSFPEDKIDFGWVIQWKTKVLAIAAERFMHNSPPDVRTEYYEFCRVNANWLEDSALFMALKEHYKGAVWTQWEEGARSRDPQALSEWRTRLADSVTTHKFLQFAFFKQWNDLRNYCRDRGIQLMGDLPIYTAHDSADVWANPSLFKLDNQGNPTVVSGVPPDYFSSTGQLWGNPIYNWEAMAADGYRWWRDRLEGVLRLVDIVRLDHFRGFEAYWEVPAPAVNAVNGRWVQGPGAALFESLRKALGDLPLVAENLGVITPQVEAIREQFSFPGMAVLQFAFGDDPQGGTFRPHNYTRELVAYSGTHDCDTIVGWWTSEGRGESTRSLEQIQRERHTALRYLDAGNREIHWVVIRALMASVANTVLFPFQDVLGLGSEARMNQPATLGQNWRWRYRKEMITPEIAGRLRELSQLFGRC